MPPRIAMKDECLSVVRPPTFFPVLGVQSMKKKVFYKENLRRSATVLHPQLKPKRFYRRTRYMAPSAR